MKLKYIDALRGLAISGVLIIHCGQLGNSAELPIVFQYLILSGSAGVQLFYVVSAFTLFLSLSNSYQKERSPWLNFFVRRFFRIAPMYYLGICYFLWQDGLGARYWLGDAERVTMGNILSNFLFVHGLNPYWITSVVPGGWTIAVEALFYCLVPLLFISIRNAQHAFGFLLATLALRVVLLFAFSQFQPIGSERLWQEYLYFYLPNQLPVFALGILLYFVIRDSYKVSISPGLIAVAGLFLLARFLGVPILPFHILFGIGFFFLALYLSKHELKVIVNPALTYIGKISYSMYLVHFAVSFWLVKLGWVDFLTVTDKADAVINFGIRLIELTALSIVVSSISYRLIELPLQNFGKKLLRRPTGKYTSDRPNGSDKSNMVYKPPIPASPGTTNSG